jgi:diguanylate cyclase (GGDEF)-like protein/PAS domain S-box-containing protein
VTSSEDAIISKNLQGIITSWNEGAQQLFGYSAADMVGRSITCLLPRERLYEEQFILEKIAAGERIHHFETVRMDRNGAPLAVSASVSPIRAPEGSVIGAATILRSIGERVRVSELETLLAAIVQSSDDAIVAKDLRGTITSWNRGAENMFGYSAEEMVGQPILRLLPPDRVQEETFILEKIMAGEQVDHFETVRQHKDGTLLHVSVSISPIRNRAGEVVGAAKIARDIGARLALMANLRLTATVFEHSGEGIVLCDAQGRIRRANKAFAAITGYARDELEGKSLAMFSVSRLTPAVIAARLAELHAHGKVQGELWSRRRDGEPFAGLLTVSRIGADTDADQGYVALLSDVTALRLEQERMHRLAHFDALTNLPNRHLLSEHLQHAVNNCARQGANLAVLYMDLDNFKAINDSLGHDVGDAALIAFSGRIGQHLREGDTFARIGGDEFVIVLNGVESVQHIIGLLDRLMTLSTCDLHIGTHTVQLSVSMGVTIYPDDHADPELLMRHADHAMYVAKQQGKNRYHFFDAALDQAARRRGDHLRRLTSALDNGELVLFYQPKVDMRDGRLVGVEALIRWRHPERGLLAPAAFLPDLDGQGLSARLDLWVIRQALEQMAAWRRAGHAIAASVNVSGCQLQDAALPDSLAPLLAAHPELPPQCLTLEVLETDALDDIGSVSMVMDRCRALGVRFAVDDFGTGYSSLTYLKRLPADTIKIDQSFVGAILTDNADAALVAAVIGLSKAFGREVIAEGVETEAIGNKLLELGCHLAQGYAIARPMPGEQLLEWLDGWQSFASWRAGNGNG